MGRATFFLASFLLALPSADALADLSKLDGNARIAYDELRQGTNSKGLPFGGLTTSSNGVLSALIVGTTPREELAMAGARVRTSLRGMCTADIPLDAVERVAALGSVERIIGAPKADLLMDQSVPASGVDVLRGAAPVFSGINGKGVLVGVIDTGIDLDHGDFQDEAGNTRLVSLWDQTVSGTPPAPYTYGHECSQADIDGGSCFQVDTGEHGTHVFGIAAGDGSQTGSSVPPYTYAGMAPRADLISVKVDFPVNLFDVIDACAYIFDVATARGQDAVINLSLGALGGPHDGTHPIDLAFDALTGPGHVIVAAAGNSRGDPLHGEVFASGGGSIATIEVAGASTGSNFFVSGYYDADDEIDWTLTSPGGQVFGPLVRGSSFLGATPSGILLLQNFTTMPTGDKELVFAVQQTASTDINGTWTFTATSVSIGATGEVDLWRHTQSNVTASFDIGLDPDEIVATPGSANEVIQVAAYTTRSDWISCNGTLTTFGEILGDITSFSSPGPRRDGGEKPDIAAPGAQIIASQTQDIPLSCPPAPDFSYLIDDGLNHRVWQGTSMATPHVTGAVALLLQAHGSLTPSQVKALLFDQAKVDGFTGPVWNKDFGHGKLLLEPDLALQAFSKRIASGSDDAEQSTPGSVSLSSADLELVQDGYTRQVVGLRFTGVAIPREAQITRAWVQFTADEEHGGTSKLSIRAQDSDNPPTFTSSTRNITNRATLPDSVVWQPGGWNNEGDAGSPQQTSDLSVLIQALVNRPGWQKGNALALIFRGIGTRTAVAYEGNRFKAAQLFVEYRTGLPTNHPPVVNAGPDQSIVFGREATLSWSVTDDGLPTSPGATSSLWSKTSGPGNVTFLPSATSPTRARFGAPGTYLLDLTASDGNLSASDQVEIRVTAAPIDARIAAGSDDAEESRSGSVSISGNDLELVEDESSRQVVGLRFRNLPIPTGSVIDRAYVQFRADESQSGSIRLVIRTQNSANPPAFTTSTRNISNRSLLPDSVVWQPGSWSSGAAGSAQRTPELKALIQGAVSIGGWAPGNAIALIIRGSGHRTAESYEGEGAPVLHVEYTPPAAAGPVSRLGSESTIDAGLRLAALVAPNPMRGAGTLRLTVGRAGPVRVEVLDVQGRRVGTVLDSPHLEAGQHPIALRGEKPLTAGVYFYRVRALEGVVRGRFVVLE